MEEDTIFDDFRNTIFFVNSLLPFRPTVSIDTNKLEIIEEDDDDLFFEKIKSQKLSLLFNEYSSLEEFKRKSKKRDRQKVLDRVLLDFPNEKPNQRECLLFIRNLIDFCRDELKKFSTLPDGSITHKDFKIESDKRLLEGLEIKESDYKEYYILAMNDINGLLKLLQKNYGIIKDTHPSVFGQKKAGTDDITLNDIFKALKGITDLNKNNPITDSGLQTSQGIQKGNNDPDKKPIFTWKGSQEQLINLLTALKSGGYIPMEDYTMGAKTFSYKDLEPKFLSVFSGIGASDFLKIPFIKKATGTSGISKPLMAFMFKHLSDIGLIEKCDEDYIYKNIGRIFVDWELNNINNEGNSKSNKKRRGKETKYEKAYRELIADKVYTKVD